MSSLFPLISGPESASKPPNATEALYRDVVWDAKNDRPLWRRGAPVFGTGADAVAAWAIHALRTERGTRDPYTTDYGLGLRALAGQPFTEGVKQSEAIRYVKDCLEINPYIISVHQIQVIFSDSTLTIECAIETIYGEVTVHANL